MPFYQGEVTDPQGLGQPTVNSLITQGGQAASGATGAAEEKANLLASRTGNTAAVPGIIDSAARSGMQQQSNNALNVGIQNAQTKLQQQQQGAQGLAGLYNTGTEAQLKSLGLSDQSIQDWTQADAANPWNSVLPGIVKAGAGAAIAACWIAAVIFGGWLEPRTVAVRTWLSGPFKKHWYGRGLMWVYERYGERLSRHPRFVKLIAPLFWLALKKAQWQE